MAEQVRWLDEEEQRAWRAFLSAVQLLFERLDRDLQHDSGIPHTYYEVLVRLSEAPGRSLRMGQLAAATFTSPSRISHAVRRLEGRGWVRRDECDGDRRGALACLTAQGMAALEAAAPDHVRSVRAHLLDQLTRAEVAGLGAMSAKLVAHLEQERRRPRR